MPGERLGPDFIHLYLNDQDEAYRQIATATAQFPYRSADKTDRIRTASIHEVPVNVQTKLGTTSSIDFSLWLDPSSALALREGIGSHEQEQVDHLLESLKPGAQRIIFTVTEKDEDDGIMTFRHQEVTSYTNRQKDEANRSVSETFFMRFFEALENGYPTDSSGNTVTPSLIRSTANPVDLDHYQYLQRASSDRQARQARMHALEESKTPAKPPQTNLENGGHFKSPIIVAKSESPKERQARLLQEKRHDKKLKERAIKKSRKKSKKPASSSPQ